MFSSPNLIILVVISLIVVYNIYDDLCIIKKLYKERNWFRIFIRVLYICSSFCVLYDVYNEPEKAIESVMVALYILFYFVLFVAGFRVAVEAVPPPIPKTTFKKLDYLV